MKVIEVIRIIDYDILIRLIPKNFFFETTFNEDRVLLLFRRLPFDDAIPEMFKRFKSRCSAANLKSLSGSP